MKKDLTQGSVTKTMLLFAGPMILGNLLQQCYNIADTLIVGRFLGADALAAVGSAYTLMTFLTSILIGLCMGSGAVFSVYFGRKDLGGMKRSMCASFFFISAASLLMNGAVFFGIHLILRLLQVPQAVYDLMYDYVWVIFFGIFFVFLYNYFAFLLRAVGNSLIPLCFLGGAAFLNIVLDLVFVMSFSWGVKGAALATVIAQAVSGIGIGVYAWFGMPELRPGREEIRLAGQNAPEILRHSFAACVQQSVMNFGILMIQGLVNSFGTAVMAAFAAAVKIDSFAYMPAQEFGNAFSLFISQNHAGISVIKVLNNGGNLRMLLPQRPDKIIPGWKDRGGSHQHHHDLTCGKPSLHQHMAQKPISRILIIRTDFKRFQHPPDCADNLICLLIFNHALLHRHKDMGPFFIGA